VISGQLLGHEGAELVEADLAVLIFVNLSDHLVKIFWVEHAHYILECLKHALQLFFGYVSRVVFIEKVESLFQLIFLQVDRGSD